MSAKILALLFFLGFASLETQACKCRPVDPVTHVCSAEFVGLVRVTGERSVEQRRLKVYEVQVLETWRTSGSRQAVSAIETNESSAACGVTMIPSQNYFISARRSQSHPENLSVYSCGSIVRSTEYLKPDEEKQLREYVSRCVDNDSDS